MPASAADMERWAVLKTRLVEYGSERRFTKEIKRALKEWYGSAKPDIDEGERLDSIDEFVLEWTLVDGQTVVDHFVAEHSDLSEADRLLLLGWRDVVEGVFRVAHREGDSILTANLVDELTYRIYANAGPAVFDKMPPDSYLFARVVPVPGGWMLSGVTRTVPAGQSDQAFEQAVYLTETRKDLVFRNPDKLALAREREQVARQLFIEFFGADLVIIPAATAAKRLGEYLEFLSQHDDDPEDTVQAGLAHEENGLEPLLEQLMPAVKPGADTLALLYDESDGLHFFDDYDKVIETFEEPELANERSRAALVRRYVEDPRCCSIAIDRLARSDPDKASRVFRVVLRRPEFDWQSDGDALLAEHRGGANKEVHYPSDVPLSEELAAYRDSDPLLGGELTQEWLDAKPAELYELMKKDLDADPFAGIAQPTMMPGISQRYSPVDLPPLIPSGATLPRVGRTPGRNDPCPCGSGKKYKRCCGG